MHPIHPIENSSGRKRQLRRWILLLAVVLTLLLILFWRNSAKGDPDVILISMDTTRADHFGCYGNKWIKTPNVDALAGDSILFTNYLTVVPSTLASHVSLFTGKYPHHHGISSIRSEDGYRGRPFGGGSGTAPRIRRDRLRDTLPRVR
ncbi:sulfatase-like hydrolase/transferase [Candidatus Sumerlaeota bacterium]|nr:sulfatase-like hydrolase/transferase [Candidatus Sumerlaeota bacterium]